MTPNRRLIYSNWLFNKKRDVLISARLVPRGNAQSTRVELTENYSPVVTDVILHVIILIWLINKWDSHNIDVETEFLYAVLEEDIYMKMP